jgi:hypothetical protein
MKSKMWSYFLCVLFSAGFDAAQAAPARRNYELSGATGALVNTIETGQKLGGYKLSDQAISAGKTQHAQKLQKDLDIRGTYKHVIKGTLKDAEASHDTKVDYQARSQGLQHRVTTLQDRLNEAHDAVARAQRAYRLAPNKKETKKELDSANGQYKRASDALLSAHDALLTNKHNIEIQRQLNSFNPKEKESAQKRVDGTKRAALGKNLVADEHGMFKRSTQLVSKVLSKKNGLFGLKDKQLTQAEIAAQVRNYETKLFDDQDRIDKSGTIEQDAQKMLTTMESAKNEGSEEYGKLLEGTTEAKLGRRPFTDDGDWEAINTIKGKLTDSYRTLLETKNLLPSAKNAAERRTLLDGMADMEKAHSDLVTQFADQHHDHYVRARARELFKAKNEQTPEQAIEEL